MTTTYDDPNREAVGVQPIWTGAGDPQRDADEAAPTKATKKAPAKDAPAED